MFAPDGWDPSRVGYVGRARSLVRPEKSDASIFLRFVRVESERETKDGCGMADSLTG